MKQQKLKFTLEKDAEGYPPADYEWVWVTPCGDDVYEIDNIPFFAKCVAVGDKVEAAENSQGELCYKAHSDYSGHSTFRVIIFDPTKMPDLRRSLEELGCASELSHLPSLIAVDLPKEVNISAVRHMLELGEAKELWEIEEACIWD